MPPGPTTCHESRTTKACKPHAHVLVTCKAHAQNQSTSDVPVHTQSTYMSQCKLFQTKMCKTYLQVRNSRLHRNIASLCFCCRVPFVSTHADKQLQQDRLRSKLLQVKEQERHLKHLHHICSVSPLPDTLQSKAGWLYLRAKSFGYPWLMRKLMSSE